MAACSSALVGSLMGDLVRAEVGDEDAGGRPHIVVALLTDATVDFSGEEGPSLATAISALGVEVSLSVVALELSTLDRVGSVGNGRENREELTTGDGDGDATLGDSTFLGSGDFCGVLYDPDVLLSVSREAGFLGMPGDKGLGKTVDPECGDCFVDVCDPETLRSSSAEVGFLGSSGVVGVLPKFPEMIRDD